MMSTRKPTCQDSATTLCLQQSRFRVTVDWVDFESTGSGSVVNPGNGGGVFYFFDTNNWEMLVRVIDGCGSFNDRFWVFAAATTNVEYELRVTDTVTGQERLYTNPLGQDAPAILDTSAFATCD